MSTSSVTRCSSCPCQADISPGSGEATGADPACVIRVCTQALERFWGFCRKLNCRNFFSINTSADFDSRRLQYPYLADSAALPRAQKGLRTGNACALARTTDLGSNPAASTRDPARLPHPPFRVTEDFHRTSQACSTVSGTTWKTMIGGMVQRERRWMLVEDEGRRTVFEHFQWYRRGVGL
jgi:hypothetical protein